MGLQSLCSRRRTAGSQWKAQPCPSTGGERTQWKPTSRPCGSTFGTEESFSWSTFVPACCRLSSCSLSVRLLACAPNVWVLQDPGPSLPSFLRPFPADRPSDNHEQVLCPAQRFLVFQSRISLPGCLRYFKLNSSLCLCFLSSPFE